MIPVARWILFFSLFFFSPLTTFAWNAYGHMLIADIAYQNLKPAVKDKVDNLVTTMHQEYPEIGTFLNLADWPDTIRGQKIDTYMRWHYINIAFSQDGTPLKDLIMADNAVWAVNSIEPVVKNDKANVYERARFLSFLSHIVGDLHQPLHTVSHISAATPDGDRGGNGYYVMYKNKRINVHALWDEGVGAFEGSYSKDKIHSAAKSLMQQYPEAMFNELPTDLKPEHWANEGLENAKQYVYNTTAEQAVSTSYVENGKRIAQQEAVLAGYRLANLLNLLLA